MKKTKSKRNDGEPASPAHFEQQMRNLVNYNLDGILVISLDGFALFANPAACKLLNRPLASLLDVEIGLPLSGEDYTEIEVPRPTGSLTTVEMRVHGIEWDGKPAWLADLRDITERKQAETALRESEEKMRSIFRVAPTGIGVVQDRMLLDVNPRICEMTGYAKEELVGNNARMLYPTQADFEFVGSEKYRQIAEKGTGQVETRWRKKDGTIVDILLSSTPIDLSNHARGVIFTALDITERKKTEIGLSRYTSQLENAERFAKLGSWEFDVTTGKGWWSKQMYRMFGFEVSDSVPDYDTYLERIHPEDRHVVLDVFMKMGKGEEPLAQEYRSNPEFGPMRQFLPTVYTQKDKAGNPIRFIGTLLDVTENRKAERTIEQQNQDLRLINSLNESANRGDDLDSILDKISHEARNSFGAQNVALFLLTPDEQHLEMRSSKLPPQAKEMIESLLETSISKFLIRLDDSPLIHTLLASNQGSITNSPQELQQWVHEIFMSMNIPSTIRALASELAPQIHKIGNINSAISVPLVSSKQTIGMIGMSGAEAFNDEDLQRVRNIAHQITTIILRQNAEADVRRQLQRIIALNQIDRAISGSLDMRLSLDVLLGEVITQLGVDAAGVLLLNPVDQSLEFIAGQGFRVSATSMSRMSRMSFGQGFAGQVGVERKVLHIPNLLEMGDSFRRIELLKGENFIEYFGVPLVAKGVLKGVLEIFNRTPLNTSSDWEDYLETLGGQAAIAIDNAQMFESMQRSNQELITAYDATILGWSLAMDLRDQETEGHTQRVTELTVKLARRMGISQQDLVHIRRGALLHDIGKLGVPDHILLKPEPLSQIEWAIMRQHPTYAYKMLLPIHYLRPALEIPYCHHEKWDGTGYPRGLKGENIPIAARIFTVADVWDALRTNRPYRKSWSVEETRLYIQNEAGRHFDPEIAAEFIKLLGEITELD